MLLRFNFHKKSGSLVLGPRKVELLLQFPRAEIRPEEECPFFYCCYNCKKETLFLVQVVFFINNFQENFTYDRESNGTIYKFCFWGVLKLWRIQHSLVWWGNPTVYRVIGNPNNIDIFDVKSYLDLD